MINLFLILELEVQHQIFAFRRCQMDAHVIPLIPETIEEEPAPAPNAPRTSTMLEKTDILDLSEISTAELAMDNAGKVLEFDRSMPLSPIQKEQG